MFITRINLQSYKKVTAQEPKTFCSLFYPILVYSDDYGMCLAQKFIDEKTNEIPAAQELLGLMDLKGP